VVLGFSQDGACSDLFENLSVISLKRDLRVLATYLFSHCIASKIRHISFFTCTACALYSIALPIAVLPLHHKWNPRQLGNLKRGKTRKQSYFRPFSLTYCTFSAIKYLGKIPNSFYNMKEERDFGVGPWLY